MQNFRSFLTFSFLILLLGAKPGPNLDAASPSFHSFGERGGFKMIYDRRQGPVAMELNDGRIYIAYQGRAELTPEGSIAARPLATVFDPERATFSNPVILGPAGMITTTRP